MDINLATEVAYKNGYRAGQAALIDKLLDKALDTEFLKLLDTEHAQTFAGMLALCIDAVGVSNG